LSRHGAQCHAQKTRAWVCHSCSSLGEKPLEIRHFSGFLACGKKSWLFFCYQFPAARPCAPLSDVPPSPHLPGLRLRREFFSMTMMMRLIVVGMLMIGLPDLMTIDH
jgi:hypothetical protein